VAREVEKKERERKGRILRDKKERERERRCVQRNGKRWRHVVM
jgi:hypothetical protein